MELLPHELKNLLTDAAELGGTRALIGIGKLSPTISKAEAYRLYGRSQVNRWIDEHLIIPQKDGENTCRVRLDRMRLETIAKSSNRLSYFANKE